MARVATATFRSVTPPPKQTISAWADANRYLSSESASEPGRWSTSRAEYLRGIMDAVSDAAVHTVVCMKGSQIGWTEVLNNCAGFFMDRDPAPLLVIQPTLEMGEAWSKDRLAPMLRDTPTIRGLVKDARARDSDNTLLHKVFPGGHITIVGANSPASLASRPIRIVLADEIDRYPVSAGSEGDPLKLAAKRQITFWNRKTILGSTPTLKATSVINREWLRSDQRRFFVPCPDCGHFQHLRWEQVRWDKEGEGADKRHKPETAHYVCEDCGTLWDDPARWGAVSHGEWRATAEFKGIAGFHVPGFLSSWLTLPEIVAEFLEAKDSPELLQVFVNTILGEVWEEQGETVDSTSLAGRAEAYDAESLPDEIIALTAGVDTQDDRLEVQVIAWGAHEESWPCLYEVIHGDPAQPAVWSDLDGLLLQSFKTQDGRTLRIRAACIDSGGHHGAAVLSFARARRARRVFAIKGQSGPKPVWPKRVTRGKSRAADVFMVGVDTAKDAIYGRLRIAAPGPGYVHFPKTEGFEADYFAQLTSETVVTRYREGRPYRVWVLPKGKRNEALDTYVYAFAALRSTTLRLDRPGAPPPRREAHETPDAPAADEMPPAAAIAPTRTGPPKKRQSSWWGKRRSLL